MCFGALFLSGIGGMKTFQGNREQIISLIFFISSENRCFKLLRSADLSVILRAPLLWKECFNTHQYTVSMERGGKFFSAGSSPTPPLPQMGCWVIAAFQPHKVEITRL